MIKIWTMLAIITSIFSQVRTDPTSQYQELGKVSWLRNYDKALQLAEKVDKPVLILFQEVPGCMTCKYYGDNVLSHPLMIEAIEDQFVPLVVYNNKGGEDAKILKKYKEASWNNPVVRIVDHHGDDIIDRLAGDYSAIGLIEAMIESLGNHPIPDYIKLMKQEIEAKDQKSNRTAYYSMYCYWTGEKQFGKLSGVLATQAGYMNGKEVVRVTYDESVLNKDDLDSYATKYDCSVISSNYTYRQSSDIQYYLQKSNYKYLPLTPIQRTKINSALGRNLDASRYLSPKQMVWLQKLDQFEHKQVLFDQDFGYAWAMISK